MYYVLIGFNVRIFEILLHILDFVCATRGIVYYEKFLKLFLVLVYQNILCEKKNLACIVLY